MRKILVIMLAVGVLFFGTFWQAPTAEAASTVTPTGSDNLYVGAKSYSSLTATSDGFMRVYYDNGKVGIEYYDDSFNIKSKKSIAMELSRWGGFYAGSNAYYLVEGQNNTAEITSAEVIRVIKYDTNWNRLGAASITGDSAFAHEIRYPFDSFSCEMDEYNGTLYVVTAHEGYVDSDYNQGHTGFLMLAVDETAMTGRIVDADLWHSFAQYIEHKGSTFYVLEQSEGSRYTKLSYFDHSSPQRSNNTNGIAVLKYGGNHTSAWSIPCYATVDGLALSSNNVLSLGTSIDQSKYGTSGLPYNIYLTVTPMSNFTEEATTVKWLTNYTGSNKSFYGAKLTKVNDDRFMVSWEEYNSRTTGSIDDALSGFVLHYLFVDGSGNIISSEYTANAPISDCQPIVKGSKIVYCASSSNMVNFYTIDSSSGQFSKKVYRVAGENAVWDLTNGVLTISGTGAMSVDNEGSLRFSGNSGWYSSSDNCWMDIADSVTKIVIDNGITDIPAGSFKYFYSLTEVVLADSVKTIGDEAFAYCSALRKITIPSGVTSIGKDALWSGYYPINGDTHLVYATIYTYSGSVAEQYAINNKIKYELLDGGSKPTTSSSSSSSSSKPQSSSSSSKPQSSSSSSKPQSSSSSSKPQSSSSSSKPQSSSSSSKPHSSSSSSKPSSSSSASTSTSITSSDTSTPQIIPDDTSSLPDESSSDITSGNESTSSSSTAESTVSTSESSSVPASVDDDSTGTNGSGTDPVGESEPDSSDSGKPWVIPVAVGGGVAVVGAGTAVSVVTIRKRKKW